MPLTLSQPDGLYILAAATLPGLAADETLLNFANGLLPLALAHTPLPGQTLAATLFHPGPQADPLLVTLLVLDAELNVVSKDEKRVLPFPAFLSYRSILSPDQVTPDTLRLPPLNPGGRYALEVSADGFCLAVRYDLHPHHGIAGHVRLAVSSPSRRPVRLRAAEERLEWQPLEEKQIVEAIRAGSEEMPVPLSPGEQAQLIETLRRLRD